GARRRRLRGRGPDRADAGGAPAVVVDHLEELVDVLLPALVRRVLCEPAPHGGVVLDLDDVEDVAAVAPDPPLVHAGGAQRGVELVGDAGVLAVVVRLAALGDAGVQGDAFHGVILSVRGRRGGGGRLGRTAGCRRIVGDRPRRGRVRAVGPDGSVREDVVGDRGGVHAGTVAGFLGRHVGAVDDPH